MVPSPATSASRYRRRILGLGALAAGALYVIGAPIFVDRIESDLEARVPTELAALGFEGLTAEFSGQDGTLSCERPVPNPDGALEAAFDIRGVRTVDFDEASPCRALRAADAADETDETVDESTDAGADATTAATEATVPDESDDAADGDADAATTTQLATTTTDADLATIDEVVAADPNLRFLGVLLADADLPDGDAPVTLFAPSDAAFDALPAEVAARLQTDGELRDALLRHHAVAGVVATTDLADGAITALDGTELAVTTGDPISIDGASLVDVDIMASNGVVHVIDRVLTFPALEIPDDAEPAAAAATLAGGGITLTGVVASEVERNVLVTAAVDAAGVDAVVDEMAVDPATGVTADTATQLAALIAAMPTNLVSGEAGFDGAAIYASGVFANEAGRDAFTAAATAVGVDATLEPQPEATDDAADDLETELNTFVAENPILFEPASAVLDESAFTVIDRVAADLGQLGGIAVTIEGHTDSDGVAATNQQLSSDRADAVLAALVERGVPADILAAVGFGSEQPIVVDGAEDKAASRRVEFRVVATS